MSRSQGPRRGNFALNEMQVIKVRVVFLILENSQALPLLCLLNILRFLRNKRRTKKMLFLHSSCRYSHHTPAWEDDSPAFFGETLKERKGQAAFGGIHPRLCLYICSERTAAARGREMTWSHYSLFYITSECNLQLWYKWNSYIYQQMFVLLPSFNSFPSSEISPPSLICFLCNQFSRQV